MTGQGTGRWIIYTGVSLMLSLVFIMSTALWINGTPYFTLFDDAMISMRFAQNLARGNGLVWNPGGPTVEGYTNFLWTLIMALFHLLPVPESKIALVIMLLGAVILAANVVVFRGVAAEVLSKSPEFIQPVIWASALYYPLIFWTLRGLEVGFLTLLFNLMLLLSFKPSSRMRSLLLAVLSVLAVLTRTDAVLPVLLILAPSALMFWPLAALVLHTIFRWNYYGDVLPNTYYLKLYGVPLAERLFRGAESLAQQVSDPLLIPLLIVIVRLIIFFFRRKKAPCGLQRGPVLLLLLFLSQCAYSVYVGGDVWDNWGFSNRFITPVVPYIYILSALAVATFPAIHSNRRLVTYVFFIALWLPANLWAFGSWIDHGAMYVKNYDWPRIRLGLLLKEATHENAVIATFGAGTMPYFAHREAIDLLGKCDKVIAKSAPKPDFIPGHNKWDYNWSIATLKPDVVTDLWNPAGEDFAFMEEHGYEMLPNGIFVRKEITEVKREVLSLYH